jgi:hypothetical protein
MESLRSKNRNSSWSAGLVLIALGMIFLLQNLAGVSFGNWWALFILIPAAWSFWRAWMLYHEDQHITHRVANAVYGGLFPFLVAMIFLLNLNWGKIWPIFLIVLGIGSMFGLRADDKDEDSSREADNAS